MKKNTHPTIYPVVFVDTSCGAEFISTSTLKGSDTRVIDGVEYSVINVEISSASHPFFTGQHRFVDTAGRVDKFKERLAKVDAAAAARKGKKAKTVATKAKKAAKSDEK
jgi:large subunit ribosomal protein L31